tara:strand:- start:505 stop:681 length:177 start_codon:yes stop_codon:yes gene_type:complete
MELNMKTRISDVNEVVDMEELEINEIENEEFLETLSDEEQNSFLELEDMLENLTADMI